MLTFSILRANRCLSGCTRPPVSSILRPFFEVALWTLFCISCWITFGSLFEVIFGSLLGPKRRQKVELFFARFLLGLRRHFGRLLGRLGTLLGRSVFPKYCKKAIQNDDFQNRSFFAIVAPWDGFWKPFWLILGRFWTPKCAQKLVRK